MDPKTILVVEDNPLNLKLVRALLQKGRFRTLEAATAEQGIQMAREKRPDLILMDIQLPGMDGLSATRLLKQDASTKAIRVAALTSYAMEGDIEKAKDAGCEGYITKPIDTREFLDTVEKLTGNGTPPCAEAGPGHYRKRILIIDDEPLNIKLLEGLLPGDKFEILRAFDGKTGLEKAVEQAPDLILLDLMMPGIDGYEVTRRLKSDPALKEVPIIIITALGGVDDKLKALEAGADEFLNKPIQRVEILSRIRSLILTRQLGEQYLTRTQAEGLFRAGGTDSPQKAPASPSQKVLIVDNDPQEARLIQHYLSGFPVQTELAQNGEEGLKRLLQNDIDLVLLDVLLPGMDGFAVLRHLRKREPTLNTQVLFITCLADLESRAKSFEIGVDELLIKPVNGHELKVRVDRLLHKKRLLDRLSRSDENAFQEGITDPATGLYNRSYLRHFLDLEIRRSLRQKYPLSLLMCTPEDFPKARLARDSASGNRILREVGRALKDNFREIDLVAHCGEEVFAVVMPYTDPKGAAAGAGRIRKTIQNRPALPGSNSAGANLRLSVGIAVYPSRERGVDDFIRKADEALYQARVEGQGRIWLGDPLSPICEEEKLC